ncbi:HdeD family acid-resistance protein [Glaciimonas immobilis]|uniref:Uncharacterized membrane protein HdeD (DUF308 family) n=1 Tax=Glaciimonas immobilis TaxID=728004 RepID=A0A840S0Q3_9BURK|nr:DUF308 domain-containing protein [Glaciimonas immobilis]KAF3996279.1 DUF308 domain-containing protein [Glaciimonas immobilis]MBB5202301.1 uncharacterized membrane protein HdeD (DUF308 family) [Glaciimonas immobilis]
MIRLALLLLGADYLRKRWRTLRFIGWLWVLAGLIVFIDALDNALYFPINFFAWILIVDGLSTLAVAWTGIGGQRILRYVKGIAFLVAAALILAGHHHGNFILSMIFGTLFLTDGLLQSLSAWIVRYPRWRTALTGGSVEILLAIFFYQPYPTHYVGTVPYCLGLGLFFSGWSMLLLSYRVHRMPNGPLGKVAQEFFAPGAQRNHASTSKIPAPVEWDGPPAENERALIIHIWTPVGSSKNPGNRRPLVDRYIASVDANGVISTGHAALESPEGIYISLYPDVEIDRSSDDFSRLLRATDENNVPGVFQPDYLTESQGWCSSTTKVRIRNYSPERLRAFWEEYKKDATYNLTYRNCSSTVSKALEAAVEGAIGHLHGPNHGWIPFVRMLITPELWVAAQIRKRAKTMAWTPGLTLDYARALSMLVDPRPFGWLKMTRLALKKIYRSRRQWREERLTLEERGPSR